ncbi:VOC family protein [Labrys neptuniae]
MPNLENLKKQAKQYLRWHRQRHYPVAAQIRAGLPRFHHLDDTQMLAAKFQLADALELVARQLGYEGWEALNQGAPAMTNAARPPASKTAASKTAASPPVLSSTTAQLFVANLTASCAFFTEKLGFSVDFIYGEPPFYGQIRRDRALLALRLVHEPVFVGDIRRREELLSAAITLDGATEIKQLFLDFQAAGVAFHHPLRREPWGARTFIVLDPDGNLILFAGPGE